MTDPRSERLTPNLAMVLAPNPGPMTLTGTNTWIVGDPDVSPPAVVDPGPLHEDHLRGVLAGCRGRISVILLTHRHADHSEGAARLAALGRWEVRAADPTLRLGRSALVDGDLVEVAGVRLTAFATPGHTADSFSFLLTSANGPARLLTGDTVLGAGTTVISQPDGSLGDYLASLNVLERLVVDAEVAELLPGHGPRAADPVRRLQDYRSHRLERLDQIRAALAAGDRTAADIVRRVYAEVDATVWPAAEQSVAAQLQYLAEREGRATS